MARAIDHPLYSTWEGMRQRCNNPNSDGYAYYGGRGIKICCEWDDFWQFVRDVGDKPAPTFTLDRIDGNLGYTSGNVRWASKSDQSRNCRVTERNKSGCKGVFWFARTNRWMTYVDVNRIRIPLGYYASLLDACAVRKGAEKLVHDATAFNSFVESVRARLDATPNHGRFKCQR